MDVPIKTKDFRFCAIINIKCNLLAQMQVGTVFLCVNEHQCTFLKILLPAEVEQWSRGGGDAVTWPAKQMKLSQGPGLLCLDVLQVEASHQEVLTPDVLRHQVHLDRRKVGCESSRQESSRAFVRKSQQQP